MLEFAVVVDDELLKRRKNLSYFCSSNACVSDLVDGWTKKNQKSLVMAKGYNGQKNN